jgi:hypothetical protein
VKHFVNQELNAPNVLKIKIDVEIVNELRVLFNTPLSDVDYCVSKPQWNSDIMWISPNSIVTFRIFYSIFKRIEVSRHVETYLDLDKKVRMYAGFLVVRSVCHQADFHFDWIDTDNEAFTLITPLSADPSGFGLLYQTLDGQTAEYDYKAGEALIFGDKFLHSTKPGHSADPVVLLSFTFGSDKMEHWDKIARTAGYQGNLLRLPNGHFSIRNIDE